MDLEKADELWCPPAGSQRYVHPEKASREIWSRTHLGSSYSSTFMTPNDLNGYIISFKFLVCSPVKHFAGLVTMYLRRLVEYLAPGRCSRNGSWHYSPGKVISWPVPFTSSYQKCPNPRVTLVPKGWLFLWFMLFQGTERIGWFINTSRQVQRQIGSQVDRQVGTKKGRKRGKEIGNLSHSHRSNTNSN